METWTWDSAGGFPTIAPMLTNRNSPSRTSQTLPATDSLVDRGPVRCLGPRRLAGNFPQRRIGRYVGALSCQADRLVGLILRGNGSSHRTELPTAVTLELCGVCLVDCIAGRRVRVPAGQRRAALDSLGPIGIQPSEFAKPAFVLGLARYLMHRDSYRRLSGLAVPLVLVFVPMLLVLKEPDLGTALVFLPVLFVMLVAAGALATPGVADLCRSAGNSYSVVADEPRTALATSRPSRNRPAGAKNPATTATISARPSN